MVWLLYSHMDLSLGRGLWEGVAAVRGSCSRAVHEQADALQAAGHQGPHWKGSPQCDPRQVNSPLPALISSSVSHFPGKFRVKYAVTGTSYMGFIVCGFSFSRFLTVPQWGCG